MQYFSNSFNPCKISPESSPTSLLFSQLFPLRWKVVVGPWIRNLPHVCSTWTLCVHREYAMNESGNSFKPTLHCHGWKAQMKKRKSERLAKMKCKFSTLLYKRENRKLCNLVRTRRLLLHSIFTPRFSLPSENLNRAPLHHYSSG